MSIQTGNHLCSGLVTLLRYTMFLSVMSQWKPITSSWSRLLTSFFTLGVLTWGISCGCTLDCGRSQCHKAQRSAAERWENYIESHDHHHHPPPHRLSGCTILPLCGHPQVPVRSLSHDSSMWSWLLPWFHYGCIRLHADTVAEAAVAGNCSVPVPIDLPINPKIYNPMDPITAETKSHRLN